MSDHGASKYSNDRCRCDVCRQGHREMIATRRAVRMMNPIPAHVQHGSSCYTNWGCRCDVCRRGHNASLTEYHERKRKENRETT